MIINKVGLPTKLKRYLLDKHLNKQHFHYVNIDYSL